MVAYLNVEEKRPCFLWMVWDQISATSTMRRASSSGLASATQVQTSCARATVPSVKISTGSVTIWRRISKSGWRVGERERKGSTLATEAQTLVPA